MSAEPTPPEEPDVVTREALEDRLRLFERGLKERFEEERRKRQGAEREAETEAKLKRSQEWLNRLQSALVGFIVAIFFAVCLQQCGDLYHRLWTLENKQSK